MRLARLPPAVGGTAARRASGRCRACAARRSPLGASGSCRRERQRERHQGRDAPRVDVDRGVVDQGVDSADRVHLVRHAARLVGSCEIPDGDARRARSEVGESRRTRRVPRLQHHLVPVVEKTPRRGETQLGRLEAGGRLRPARQQTLPICRMLSTGATGLELATCGVTGRVGYNDARQRTPLNVVICRRFSFRGWLRSAWLSQSSDRRLGHEWATESCLHRQPDATALGRVPHSGHARSKPPRSRCARRCRGTPAAAVRAPR